MQYIFDQIVSIPLIENVYTNKIPEDKYLRSIKNHDLNYNTKILFLHESDNYDFSLVITYQSLSIFEKNQLVFATNWCNHDGVVFNDGNLSLDLTLNGKGTEVMISLEDFGMSSEMVYENEFYAVKTLTKLLNEFVNYAFEHNNAYEKTQLELEELGDFYQDPVINPKQSAILFDKVISIYDKYVCDYGDEVMDYRLKYALIIALSGMKNHKTCLEEIDFVLNNFENDINKEVWYEFKAEALDDLNNQYDAIIYFKKAYELTKTHSDKIRIENRIKEVSEIFKNNFANLSYDKRKLILIDNELKSTPEDSFIVLDKKNLPTELQFPNKIAKSKELYIAHPFVKGSYLPFINYEEELATNKFKEFFYFVQCLGAKKITYKIIEGNDSEKTSDRNLDIDAKLGIGKSIVKNTLEGKFENNSHKNSIDKNLLATSQSQTFTPTKAPYLPEKLLFYPHEISWHWLYEQRLAGGFDSHKEEITSKKSEIINESEKINLKMAFKNLFVDASVNINHLVEETFKQNKLKKWIIEIEFEPIENLKNIQINPIFTDNEKTTVSHIEQEYIEELQFMLEDDGVIDDKERKSLERFRLKFGISEEVALKLENNLINNGNLTQNEKAYLEEYQELLNDGEISDKERRILVRMANRLNISEERVGQLEKL